VASVRFAATESAGQQAGQYEANLNRSDKQPQSEEATINAVNNTPCQRFANCFGGGNGFHAPWADREALAQERSSWKTSLVALSIAVRAAANICLADSRARRPPFVKEPDGTYTYQGDEGQRRFRFPVPSSGDQ